MRAGTMANVIEKHAGPGLGAPVESAGAADWSAAAIGVACVMIAGVMMLARRRQLTTSGALLLTVFIAACGVGFFLDALPPGIIPDHTIGAAKPLAAVFCWSAALLLVVLLPRVLRGPIGTDVRFQLAEQARQRSEAEDNLRDANIHLAEVHEDLKFRSAAIDEHAIVATTDPKGKITFVNDKFCAISGYSREELLGQDHRMINSGHHPRSFFRDMFHTIAAGRVWHGEIKNRAKNGTYYWVQSTIMPFVGPDGKIRQYIAIRDDITHLKATEEKLQETVQQLKASTEELDRRNSELEQLVYTVSHDLKTPLVTILGFATHVIADMEAGKKQEVAEDAQRIIRAARKLKGHIDELLEFGRIGRVANPPEQVDLNAALDEALEEVRIQLDELEVKPVRKLGIPTILADRVRLMQVLQNLLSNALKYGCPGKGAYLEVGSVDGVEEVCLYVRDRGPGIAAEHQERIFALFQHLGTHPDSSGVGLAHVRRIAQVHGGKAWVESTPGQGATFWVSFAASAARQLQSRPAQKARAA